MRIDFDTDSYEQARLAGSEAYSIFREGLEYPDISDSLMPVPSDMNPYDGRIENERRLALDFLPRSDTDLPLRNLARLGGHATWGELEVFYYEPLIRGAKIPASQKLRQWYAAYAQEFATVFPEHSRPRLRAGLAGLDPEFDHFPDRLQGVAAEVALALDRQPGRLLLLAVLLRDYAAELRPLARSFNFSIDALIREALLSAEHGGRPSETLAYYDEILEREDLPPGPGPMLAALAIPGIPEINFALPRNDLLPALRNLARGSDARDKRADLPSQPTSQTVPPDILSHANSDQPTAEDKIGVEPLVEGLRALLDDQRTGLALSIGITAPWGGGKSSVMRQLAAALEGDHPDRTRHWIPVHFDAWKYERSERLWAALSKAIYEQGLKQMSWRQRTAFKFRLERARRGWFALLVLPLAVASLVLAGVIALALNVSAVGGALAIAATLLGFSGFAASVWGLLSDPFKRAIAGYVSDPAYEEQLGFTSDADADIRLLTQQLTDTDNRALVVFVDDLDRCSPRYVVEAVEAINQIFNAAEDSRCVFILGMDRDLIAASIQVAYAETIENLPEVRKSNFGLHFLAKLVQLSVAVPAPGPDGIKRLLDSIGDGLALRLPAGGPLYVEPRSRNERGEQAQRSVDVHLGRLDNAPDGGGEWEDMPSAQSALSTGEAPDVDESSPEFHIAERLAVRYLEPNPREVKRFDNAFRLQLLVARRTPGCELDFGENDLIAIGAWVAMRLRWPDLAVAIDRDPELLGRLERSANEAAYDSPDRPWSQNLLLRELLREDNEARRIARLQDRTFLRIS